MFEKKGDVFYKADNFFVLMVSALRDSTVSINNFNAVFLISCLSRSRYTQCFEWSVLNVRVHFQIGVER